MADRFMDERDREWRERDWRRSEEYARGGHTPRAGEDRSWSGASDDDRDPYDYRSRPDRDRDYGEGGRDYGESSRLTSGGGAYGAGGAYGGGESYGRGAGGGRPQGYRGQGYQGQSHPDQSRQGQGYQGQGYQGQNYQGQGGQSGPQRFTNQDYTGGYRGQERSGYGQGRSYSASGWDTDGNRTYNRDLERSYADHLRQPSAGGTGGYDYERGYGDAGRGREPHRPPYEERQDERGGGSGNGDFLSRAGERISNWFRGDNLMRGSREDDQGEPRRYREDWGREARPIPEPSHRGRGPKGYQRSDARISDEVHDRLTDDPWLDASNIEVTVKDGEVALGGHVDNREAKHRAERIIENVAGVRHVQNNLRVDPDAGLTSAGHGYGSSALEAQMRRDVAARDPGDNGVSGLSGRTSTGAEAERSTKR